MLNDICDAGWQKPSMRSKRFRVVPKQRKTEERRGTQVQPRQKWNENQKMKEDGSCTRPIFRAVFDSLSSFFAPKPHINACCADWQKPDSSIWGRPLSWWKFPSNFYKWDKRVVVDKPLLLSCWRYYPVQPSFLTLLICLCKSSHHLRSWKRNTSVWPDPGNFSSGFFPQN